MLTFLCYKCCRALHWDLVLSLDIQCGWAHTIFSCAPAHTSTLRAFPMQAKSKKESKDKALEAKGGKAGKEGKAVAAGSEVVAAGETGKKKCVLPFLTALHHSFFYNVPASCT